MNIYEKDDSDELIIENLSEYISLIRDINSERNVLTYHKILAKLEALNTAYNSTNLTDSYLKYSEIVEKPENITKDDLIFFRGQSKKEYKLSPSVFRTNKDFEKEQFYFYEIQRRKPNPFNGLNTIDKLVLMQHYGLPTRLLDITRNPLVALFFACRSCFEKDGYVYVFTDKNRKMKYEHSDTAFILANLAKFSKDEKQLLVELATENLNLGEFKTNEKGKYENNLLELFYSEIAKEKNTFKREIKPVDLLKPVFLMPNKTNKRIDRQEGAFILSGLSSNLVDAEQKILDLAPIIITIKNKAKILKELDFIGVNEATLFPELNNIANYLKQSYFEDGIFLG